MIKNNTNAPVAAPFYKDLLSEIKKSCPQGPKIAWRLWPTLNFFPFIGILADYWSIVKKWRDGGRAS